MLQSTGISQKVLIHQSMYLISGVPVTSVMGVENLDMPSAFANICERMRRPQWLSEIHHRIPPLQDVQSWNFFIDYIFCCRLFLASKLCWKSWGWQQLIHDVEGHLKPQSGISRFWGTWTESWDNAFSWLSYTLLLHVAFREMHLGKLIERNPFRSLSEQLYLSLTSPSAMLHVWCSCVKHAAFGVASSP